MKYVALLRGINVGGKNTISMAKLKECLVELGLSGVTTYINSGNALFESEKPADVIAAEIEKALVGTFDLDSALIRATVLSQAQFAAVVADAPAGFGQKPTVYHSDVAFLIGVNASEAFDAFDLNPEVDAIWQGNGAVYYQRLSALRAKSRMSRIVGKPIYKNMTVRNWNTVLKLSALLSQGEKISS